jgi:hypothetical protein
MRFLSLSLYDIRINGFQDSIRERNFYSVEIIRYFFYHSVHSFYRKCPSQPYRDLFQSPFNHLCRYREPYSVDEIDITGMVRLHCFIINQQAGYSHHKRVSLGHSIDRESRAASLTLRANPWSYKFIRKIRFFQRYFLWIYRRDH